MIRWFVNLTILFAILTAIRYAILAAMEPRMRSLAAADLGPKATRDAIRQEAAERRRNLGRALWLYLVGLPVGLILFLVLVGEYT